MPTILIVDDQACIRKLFSEELDFEGYRVETARNGESARAHLRFSRPDLVLLDLYLDGPNGWEVLSDIKRQDPSLPVIILTAYDSFRDHPLVSLADGYVVKSADFTELKQEIANVLRQKLKCKIRVEASKYFPGVGIAQPG